MSAMASSVTSPRAMTDAQLDQLSINTIRTLSIDAVQQAKSGHPGTPMALAPLVYTLWNRVMRFDPQDPIWPNRDRFVLSNRDIGRRSREKGRRRWLIFFCVKLSVCISCARTSTR
jgi:Transketolase, thiamine diphosphate binding domain